MEKIAEKFSDYVTRFITEHNIRDVVEIGSDIRLNVARKVAPACDIYYSVNFPKYNEILKDRNGKVLPENLFFVNGDATKLADYVPHADLILLHNVLLDGHMGEDVSRLRKIISLNSGERLRQKNNVESMVHEIASDFRRAEKKAYTNFLAVANPGYIIQLGTSSTLTQFERMLIEEIGVFPSNIFKRFMNREDSAIISQGYIIKNMAKENPNLDIASYIQNIQINKENK